MIYICTVLVGNYDFLSTPNWIRKHDNVKLLCFTDQDKINKIWTKISLPKKIDHLSTFHKHKYIKLFCDKIIGKKGTYVWVDANIYLKDATIHLINKFIKSDDDLLFVRHPSRKNPKEEYNQLISNQRFKNSEKKVNILKKQFDNYSNLDRTYEYSDLIEANFFIRKSYSDRINQFFDLWWNEINKYPVRDQLSLPYVLSQSRLKYSLLDIGKRGGSDYLNHYGHKVHNFSDIHCFLFSKRHLIAFQVLLFLWTPIHRIRLFVLSYTINKLFRK